jgi:flagellar biosynthesis/type III secretory pathway protein FliH
MNKKIANQTIKEHASRVFFQIKADKNIKVERNTKLIKAKDYANYYDASLLLEEAKNNLIKSKAEISKLQSQAKNDAYQEGINLANELIAKTNIETTRIADEYLSSIKEGLTAIILDVVKKFIQDYDDVDFLLHAINSSINSLGLEQKIELHINDTIFTQIKNRLSEVDMDITNISLIADSSMNKKDCLVVTPLGIINANIETQLQYIESAISAGGN